MNLKEDKVTKYLLRKKKINKLRLIQESPSR